ncbi:hypothetical protein T492DRAFT_903046 [Pavlovales sp. CCMP2436]|nr:hypothetical protein T492DRAFT_903046 [Pavlovales sp. CCMP2436]
MDLLADTNGRLRMLAGPPPGPKDAPLLSAEGSEAAGVALRAPHPDMVNGVAAAHALLRIGGGYGAALTTTVTVGNDGLVNRRIYAALGAAPALLRRAEAAAVDADGAADAERASLLTCAFALRQAIASAHAPAGWAIAALSAAQRILVSSPKAWAALTEIDEACGEPYAWDGPDPELANGMNGVAWPLATLAARSFHPNVRAQALALARGASAADASAGRVARMLPAEVLATFSELDMASAPTVTHQGPVRAVRVHSGGPGSLWHPSPPVPKGLAKMLAKEDSAKHGPDTQPAQRGRGGGGRGGGRGGGGGEGRVSAGGRGGRGGGGGRGGIQKGRGRGGGAGRGGRGRGRGRS